MLSSDTIRIIQWTGNPYWEKLFKSGLNKLEFTKIKPGSQIYCYWAGVRAYTDGFKNLTWKVIFLAFLIYDLNSSLIQQIIDNLFPSSRRSEINNMFWFVFEIIFTKIQRKRPEPDFVKLNCYLNELARFWFQTFSCAPLNINVNKPNYCLYNFFQQSNYIRAITRKSVSKFKSLCTHKS